MKKLFILFMLFTFNVLAEPVNINKADAETIAASLKGVGIVKARAIVSYRKKNGAFKSLADLSNVKGIGEQTIKNIASDVGLSKGKISKAKTSKKKTTKKKVDKQAKKISEKKTKKKSKKESNKKAKVSKDKKTKSSKDKKKKK